MPFEVGPLRLLILCVYYLTYWLLYHHQRKKNKKGMNDRATKNGKTLKSVIIPRWDYLLKIERLQSEIHFYSRFQIKTERAQNRLRKILGNRNRSQPKQNQKRIGTNTQSEIICNLSAPLRRILQSQKTVKSSVCKAASIMHWGIDTYSSLTKRQVSKF